MSRTKILIFYRVYDGDGFLSVGDVIAGVLIQCGSLNQRVGVDDGSQVDVCTVLFDDEDFRCCQNHSLVRIAFLFFQFIGSLFQLTQIFLFLFFTEPEVFVVLGIVIAVFIGFDFVRFSGLGVGEFEDYICQRVFYRIFPGIDHTSTQSGHGLILHGFGFVLVLVILGFVLAVFFYISVFSGFIGGILCFFLVFLIFLAVLLNALGFFGLHFCFFVLVGLSGGFLLCFFLIVRLCIGCFRIRILLYFFRVLIRMLFRHVFLDSFLIVSGGFIDSAFRAVVSGSVLLRSFFFGKA